MRQLIECVPNFSEGRDRSVIDDIANAIAAVEGVSLLDVDPGRDTNRTVITFVGAPGPVLEAAFQGMCRAAACIDMARHEGAHPRMGATDVCPLIALQGIGEAECVALAESLAERTAKALGIPVYLYGKAARRPDRVRLPDIRKGEYEALEEKLKSPSFAPDFGEPAFNPRSGATAIGVRDFLLAYNINLATRDVRLAKDIGLTVREKGRKQRDAEGKFVRDENGKAVRIPGRLKACQAGGWYIEEYGQAQVTMNLLDFMKTGLHTAFEAVSEEAAKLGLRVTGSEVVGMLPRQAILDTGAFYLKRAKQSIAAPEPEIVHHAVLGLGLNDLSRFEPSEKIIEYAVERDQKNLRSLPVSELADALSSDAPAPGGGSISALSGALSAGLSAMVANLTYGNKGHADDLDRLEDLAVSAQKLKRHLLVLMDADTAAFNAYLAARRLPKKSIGEQVARDAAIQAAAKEMTRVPLETLRLSKALVDLAGQAATLGLRSALSDAAVAGVQARAAGAGAYLNVAINLPAVDDEGFVTTTAKEARALLDQVDEAASAIMASARKTLEK